MIQSHAIDVSSVFSGAAVRTSDSFRFIAVDPRFDELEQSKWPSLSETRRVAADVINTGRLPPRRAGAEQENGR